MHENVEKFWKVESYSTLPINENKLLPKDEQRAYDTLETTTQNTNNRDEVGLLWKSENPSLQKDCKIARHCKVATPGEKFKNDPVFVKSYRL